MIKISSYNLKSVEAKYTATIIQAIESRKAVLNNLHNLLAQPAAITDNDVKGMFYEFKRALKVLIVSSNDCTDTKELVTELESRRQKYTNHKVYIKRVCGIANAFNLKNLTNVITAAPFKLQQTQTSILNKVKCKISEPVLRYLFDYDSFYDKIIAGILGPGLGIVVCPYCDRQYITDIREKNDNRIIGPTYDHFFHQKGFPLLALSFYNLIPACYICNSNLKGVKDFSLDTHLHPYIHEMEGSAHFDFKLFGGSGVKSLIDFTPVIEVTAKPGSAEYIRLNGKKKIKHSGSLNLFKLREIYLSHKDIVEEIHDKFDEANPYYSNSIRSYIDAIKTDETAFYRYYFGNYLNISDFGKRPLAKLTRDIYNKMKAISKANGYYKTI